MANNVTYVTAEATPIKGTIVETEQQGDGSQRQVVKVAESALPSGAATAANQTNGTQKVIIASATDTAAIVTGPFTGVKGLRVYGGPTDPISDIPVYIDFAHHQIHEGETWLYFYPIAALANNTSADIRISVPTLTATTRTPHLEYEIISDGAADAFIYEGTTWSANGTEQTIYNRNRNVGGAPNTKVYITGATVLTVNALGTKIWQGMLTGTKQSAGGNDRALDEWDLKSNTEYLFCITSLSATGIKALIRLTFYEDAGV